MLRDGEPVLRFGHFRSTTVPLADLVSALPVMTDTNLELRFDPPVAVEVEGQAKELRRIAFYADDARPVVALLRSRVLTPDR